MRERALWLGPERRLFAILCEPARDVGTRAAAAVLFLNAGSIHRVGPNRSYVHLARDLAERGVASLRLDLSGIGDSPPSQCAAEFGARALAEAAHAVDELAARAAPAGVIVYGMCSGADVGYELLRNPRVRGAILVNGTFGASDAVRAEALRRTAARFYRGRLREPKRWLRLVLGRSDWRTIGRLLARGLARRFRAAAPVAEATQRLEVAAGRALLVFSEGSTSWDAFRLRFGAPERALAAVEWEWIAGCDHDFTPVWAQRRLHDLALDWIARGESSATASAAGGRA